MRSSASAACGLAAAVLLAGAAPASAQDHSQPAPEPPIAAPPDTVAPDATVTVPGAVAPGGVLTASIRGLALPARLEIRRGSRWRVAGVPAAEGRRATARLRVPDVTGRLRLRARGADDRVTPSRRVTVRPLTLAAVGDVNLGDGPGAAMERHGFRYPWASVGPTLRRADVAFANLECAVSDGGTPQPKQYVFRGRPQALEAMRREAGIDVVNLANNHSGDYGDRALLDTLRHVRAQGMTAVGAGGDEAAAYQPRIVESMGLRVAFVGFSEILPFEFRALGSSPGSAWAFPQRVRESVRRARRRADVVIATFHWGVERATTESPRQRALAGLALESGATAVIGAHPHVLQPIRRPRHRLVAYSLGNFVFSAVSPGTSRTGILQVGFGRGRVLQSKLTPATIRGSRPILDR